MNGGYGVRKHMDDKIIIVFERRGVRYGQFVLHRKQRVTGQRVGSLPRLFSSTPTVELEADISIG